MGKLLKWPFIATEPHSRVAATQTCDDSPLVDEMENDGPLGLRRGRVSAYYGDGRPLPSQPSPPLRPSPAAPLTRSAPQPCVSYGAEGKGR